MRCREARIRIDEYRKTGRIDDVDSELRKHLRRCPECYRELSASRELAGILEAAGKNDETAMTALSVQRTVTEARARQFDRSKKRWLNHILHPERRHRRRVAVGLGMAAMVLLMISVVPFGYYRTVGYDLSLAGVSRDVALDNDRLCDALFAMGLVEAGVDVIGCDTTCNLLVLDLRSGDEIHQVMSAFTRMGHNHLEVEIIPVIRRASGSLLKRATEKLFTHNDGLPAVEKIG